uniref:Uncharacterized protein n=1 Tax=Nomascus leucogenys TaxID=61853 RepID=A0A2I3GQ57_NOMLE
MKTYRQREKQGTKVADSSKGPDEAKIKALLERTGYTLDVTTGQRKYGGPPPDSVYSKACSGVMVRKSSNLKYLSCIGAYSIAEDLPVKIMESNTGH